MKFRSIFSSHERDYIAKSWLYPATVNVCDHGKEGQMYIIALLSIFVSCCPLSCKEGQAERVQTMKAQPNRP